MLYVGRTSVLMCLEARDTQGAVSSLVAVAWSGVMGSPTQEIWSSARLET